MRYLVIDCESVQDIETRINGEDYDDYRVVQILFNPLHRERPWLALIEKR